MCVLGGYLWSVDVFGSTRQASWTTQTSTHTHARTHSLHWLRTWPCSQTDAPPHCLHWLRRRPCSQINAPPYSLHVLRMRACVRACVHACVRACMRGWVGTSLEWACAYLRWRQRWWGVIRSFANGAWSASAYLTIAGRGQERPNHRGYWLLDSKLQWTCSFKRIASTVCLRCPPPLYVSLRRHQAVENRSSQLLGPLGSSWLLLAPLGSSWVLLAPPSSSWALLAPLGSSQLLLAFPGKEFCSVQPQ